MEIQPLGLNVPLSVTTSINKTGGGVIVCDKMDGSKHKRLRNKIIAKEYKESHPCLICGEKRVSCLVFHHIDGEKEGTVSSLIDKHVSVLRLKKEIQKCIVVCANCHLIIHVGN